jgi:hypothetical protein
MIVLICGLCNLTGCLIVKWKWSLRKWKWALPQNFHATHMLANLQLWFFGFVESSNWFSECCCLLFHFYVHVQ